MDDDVVGGIAAVLVVLSLLAGLVFLVFGGVAVICALIVVVGVGVATNLVIRYIANQVDWRKIDQGQIWLVIAILALVPVGIGLAVTLAPPFCALVGRERGFLGAWLAVPLYLLWLGGYIWAWVDPRFERGVADVLMSSTLVTAWTKLQMWWEYNVVRHRIP